MDRLMGLVLLTGIIAVVGAVTMAGFFVLFGVLGLIERLENRLTKGTRHGQEKA
jgi:hypothetical protein